MKVPPLQNLIVSVIPPQAIVRQFVLAAATYVSALCGAAHAQSAPAAPPLSLLPAVEVSYHTAQGTTSSLEHSPDLLHWKPIAEPVYGDGENASQLISGAGGSGFYRMKVESFPETGDSRWSLTGSRMVLNSAEGVSRITFDDNAAGTLTRGSAVTPFTWQWRRDGLDTGIATLTWPDATVEAMTMQFTGKNAGVFLRQRTTNGLPAGAVSGTFRDSAERSLVLSVPAALGDSLVTFSSTGRPVGVKVSAGATAGIRTPAGTVPYDCSYVVTGPATAELNMISTTGTSESWSLKFAGPACGTFSWKTKSHGVARRSSAGSFNIASR